MNKREPLMSMEYFADMIKYMQSVPEKFNQIIARPETTETHKKRLLYSLFQDSYELLIAKYSAGYPVSELTSDFPEIILRREHYIQFIGRVGNDFSSIDDYCQSLWILSLAILLDVDDALFARTLACIGNEGRDALFEQMAATRVSNRPNASAVIFPSPFQTLYLAITAEVNERPGFLKKYLSLWYPAMGKSGTYWHENHKGPEGGGFFGYWSLEAAALVKAFSIDDSTFREARYYPADLIRYQK